MASTMRHLLVAFMVLTAAEGHNDNRRLRANAVGVLHPRVARVVAHSHEGSKAVKVHAATISVNKDEARWEVTQHPRTEEGWIPSLPTLPPSVEGERAKWIPSHLPKTEEEWRNASERVWKYGEQHGSLPAFPKSFFKDEEWRNASEADPADGATDPAGNASAAAPAAELGADAADDSEEEDKAVDAAAEAEKRVADEAEQKEKAEEADERKEETDDKKEEAELDQAAHDEEDKEHKDDDNDNYSDDQDKSALPTDPDVSDAERQELREVEKLQKVIKQQTKSDGLAQMLGSIKMDIYRLDAKVADLHHDLEDGVEMEPVDPNTYMVYPVSATMQCIIMLTALFFVVYMGVAVCKIVTEVLHLGEVTQFELALKGAFEKVFYAPMLCVLFLGAHLRALQITQGKAGPQEWVTMMMQLCAWSVLVQTLVVLLVPILTGEVVKMDEESAGPSLELARASSTRRGVVGIFFLVQYCAMAMLYVGVASVCVAVVTMDALTLHADPKDLWDDPATSATEYAPPVSAAMNSTIVLTAFFFVVYGLCALVHGAVGISRGVLEQQAPPGSRQHLGLHLSGQNHQWLLGWETTLRLCETTVNIAPMLCILFMAARMRALQIDTKWGKPQWWAEYSFYAAVSGVIVQSTAVILMKVANVEPKLDPFAQWLAVDGIAVQEGSEERQADGAGGFIRRVERFVESKAESVEKKAGWLKDTEPMPLVGKVISAVRYAGVLVAYVAVGAVIASIVIIEAQKVEHTPQMSPTLKCVIFLTVVYLAIYLCMFVLQSMVVAALATKSAADGLLRAWRAFKMAESTVGCCPMLAVLFVSARMRALQLSNQKGSPQCWAQDAMFIASAAVLVQVVTVLVVGFFCQKISVDSQGVPVTSGMTWVRGWIAVESIKALSFIALCGGVITVVASVLAIDPQTASCEYRGFHLA